MLAVFGIVLSPWTWVLIILGLALIFVWLALLNGVGMQYIPNNRVGVVEKLWSSKGSVPAGRILARDGEAGYQVHVIRGGIHFGLWRWQFKIHKIPLVTVQGHRIFTRR
jgi:uncharacterized membrane protein YqiK